MVSVCARQSILLKRTPNRDISPVPYSTKQPPFKRVWQIADGWHNVDGQWIIVRSLLVVRSDGWAQVVVSEAMPPTLHPIIKFQHYLRIGLTIGPWLIRTPIWFSSDWCGIFDRFLKVLSLIYRMPNTNTLWLDCTFLFKKIFKINYVMFIRIEKWRPQMEILNDFGLAWLYCGSCWKLPVQL